MKQELLEERARELGLRVTTWAPGDGLRRYRFHPLGVVWDYNAGTEIGTTYGKAEAHAWLDGYAAGYHWERRSAMIRYKLTD